MQQDVTSSFDEAIIDKTIIHDRYIVERLLGKGGFGAVFLVRDGQDETQHFALKELIDQSKLEQKHLITEGHILQRLDHASLPSVYEVIKEDHATYLLMEYIAGPNLEILRKQQPENRFSLEEAFIFLAPIMSAVRYLHEQDPQIVHLDIKPANIVVPSDGTPSVLVDLGTAKEFGNDDTTAMIRHCTAGYGAPEQYSTGTNPRTDIYGLGATLYTLLTGVVPPDAVVRATVLAGGGRDPLLPASELVPGLPPHINAAIKRAMSMKILSRFDTVQEFWDTLTGVIPDASDEPAVSATPRPILQRNNAHTLLSRTFGPVQRRLSLLRPLEKALFAFLAILLLLGTGLGVRSYLLFTHATTSPSSAKGVSAPTSVSTAPNHTVPTTATTPTTIAKAVP